MKLGELLMVRAQLQKDVTEQASLVNENAVKEAESTESTTTDAEEALRGYWTVHEKVRQVQHQIQEINATTRYNDQWSMAEALLEREVLRKQLPVVTGMLKAATANSIYTGGEYRKCTPALSVPDLRSKLKDIKARSQAMDLKLQARNWEIEVREPES